MPQERLPKQTLYAGVSGNRAVGRPRCWMKLLLDVWMTTQLDKVAAPASLKEIGEKKRNNQ